MLLENVIKPNDVITLKLVTGEEILATLWTDGVDHITVTRPAVIARSPDGGMGMIPWMITGASERVNISRHSVITYCATDPDIAKAYTESTTGLQLPK